MKDIDDTKIYHVLDFLSAMFDIEVAYSIINSAICVTAIILPIPTCPSTNKDQLGMKYVTVIFNLRPPKPFLSNVFDVDISFRYFERIMIIPCSQI